MSIPASAIPRSSICRHGFIPECPRRASLHIVASDRGRRHLERQLLAAMRSPFRIKICGVTSLDDAQMVFDAGADAIGLNFYEGSPRYVSRETAAQVCRAAPPQVCCVGVFVNRPPADVAEMVEQIELDALQFHGDESPEDLAALRSLGGRLAEIPIIRAFRCRTNNYAEVAAYLHRAAEMGASLAAALIDAYAEGKYGGAGQAIDFRAFRESRGLFGDLPLILAGGLNPANIAAAIEEAKPDAVDVASGVESNPGKKDSRLVLRFVETASRALSIDLGE
jgi:phosphoribosylanthranilate isomerase